MSAQDYPVTFPYGATSDPYSPTRPHRGDDRPTPMNTPVLLDGQQVALTGNTGMTSGPHIHIQEWTGSVANTRKPQNSFKGGKVMTVSNDVNQQWGKHITIKNADGWMTTYAHLNQINVQAGQVIGGDVEIGHDTANIIHQDLTGKNWDKSSWEANAKGKNFAQTYEMVRNSQARKDYQAYLANLKPAAQKLSPGLYEV